MAEKKNETVEAALDVVLDGATSAEDVKVALRQRKQRAEADAPSRNGGEPLPREPR